RRRPGAVAGRRRRLGWQGPAVAYTAAGRCEAGGEAARGDQRRRQRGGREGGRGPGEDGRGRAVADRPGAEGRDGRRCAVEVAGGAGEDARAGPCGGGAACAAAGGGAEAGRHEGLEGAAGGHGGRQVRPGVAGGGEGETLTASSRQDDSHLGWPFPLAKHTGRDGSGLNAASRRTTPEA